MPMTPVSTKFKDIAYNGRIQSTIILLPNSTQIYMFNVYGWVNATTDDIAAMRTDDMFSAIESELAVLPKAQVAICGDFNGDLDRFPTLQRLLEAGNFVDLGAHPEMFGHTGILDTCRPHNTTQSFRRDYFL
eukprot:11114064-Karenia_brevis.AAC.1